MKFIKILTVPFSVVGALGVSLSGAADPPTCPIGLQGAPLVLVDAPTGPYCIDAYEVTQSEYAIFVEQSDGVKQSEQCAWNQEFIAPIDTEPEEDMPGSCPAGAYDPEHAGSSRVVCVDWCDASAYCAWAGKRLCGSFPTKDVPEQAFDVATKLAKAEWRYACTNGGRTKYPYGNSAVSGKCVDRSVERARLGSMGSETCVGTVAPFSSIRDLAGSVLEWTSTCVGKDCSVEGGSYGHEKVECAMPTVTPYRSIRADLGFRCCSDEADPS